MDLTTTRNEAEDQPRSRRALLAGVVGGLGAWLVSAAQRAMPAEAAEGDPVRIGQVIGGGAATTGLRAMTPHRRLPRRADGSGYRHSRRGDERKGRCGDGWFSGNGLWGYSPNHIGVFATTDTGVCVNARAVGRDSVALFADARGIKSLAVLAFGPSHFDGDVEVLGRLVVTQPMTFGQTSAPNAPSSNHARLFARDNGWGKTQLCVQFASGAVQTLATEP